MTPEERKAISIEPETYDKLIGILLSDGHVSLRLKNVNARFHFSQSGKVTKKRVLWFCSSYDETLLYSYNDTLC